MTTNKHPTVKAGDRVYIISNLVDGHICLVKPADEKSKYYDELPLELLRPASFTTIPMTTLGKYTIYDDAPSVVHATVENYEMLCKLFPGVNWQHPEPRRKGNNLCRDLLAQGKNVVCFVSDISEEDAIDRKRAALIISYDDGHTCPFRDRHTGWTFAAPIDIDTLEPIEVDNINE